MLSPSEFLCTNGWSAVKTIRITGIIYAGILLALLLFPPWSDGTRQYEGADPLLSSLGHHWRFSFPYYWGYQEDYCTDGVGRMIGCNGKSVWIPNENAVLSYRMLLYEAALGLVACLFLTLTVDLMGATLSLALSNLMAILKSRLHPHVSPSKQRARDGVKWALEHPEEVARRFALQPVQASQTAQSQPSSLAGGPQHLTPP